MTVDDFKVKQERIHMDTSEHYFFQEEVLGIFEAKVLSQPWFLPPLKKSIMLLSFSFLNQYKSGTLKTQFLESLAGKIIKRKREAQIHR